MTVGKVVELIGSSKESFEGAVENAVDEAAKTIRGIREVWVQDLKAAVENGKITEYRAGVKVTFLVEEDR
ncbi:dodecin family protein [Candidatus Bathyarchaeota archaeon]|nr:dodecin family protein [Candidatus Bathyarchaeota archaeon]